MAPVHTWRVSVLIVPHNAPDHCFCFFAHPAICAVDLFDLRRPTLCVDALTATASGSEDAPQRHLTIANADDPNMRHVAVVGDKDTTGVTGTATASRYCLIDTCHPEVDRRRQAAPNLRFKGRRARTPAAGSRGTVSTTRNTVAAFPDWWRRASLSQLWPLRAIVASL